MAVSKMNGRCWASPLGECDGPISGEHIISAGLWDGQGVFVAGGPFPKTGVRIGLNSLVVNALCRRHNELLSNLGVDGAGIKAFRGIDELDRWLGTSTVPAQKEVVVDGPLLERWFIKTAINVFWANGKGKTWIGGSDHRNPPIDLIEATYGMSALKRPKGLYSWAGESVGQTIFLNPQIESRTHI